MTIRGVLQPALVAAVLVSLAACGERGGATTPPSATTTAAGPAAGGLVLRIEYTGGFVGSSLTSGRLPLVSVYADGRVISEGPVAATYPGAALPNLQEQRIHPADVRRLVDRALAAGVADTSDLGSPPIADATSTRFTVVTASHTYVREAYALAETGAEDAGLTANQRAARTKLSHLVDTLTGPAVGGGDSAPYASRAVAALARPWSAQPDGPTQSEVAWPGPALPGQPTGALPGPTCVTASGDQAKALLAAAGSANAATPWVTADGARWSVVLRPLLPDESSCTDLVD